MSNRWLRFGIALLAIGAAAAAGYRIFQQEQRLNDHVLAARSLDVAAETAITTVSELKAALHAYISEGQGDAFWTARAATLVDRLRGSLLDLDAEAAAAGVALTETLDLTDRLAATEQRARGHVKAGQKLLAGDVIFVEARDILDAIRLQVARARTGIAQSADAAQHEIRREQAMLAFGAAGILAFATLLLVIPGRSPSFVAAADAVEAADVSDSGASPVVTPGALGAPHTPRAADAPGLSLRETAAICTDLGRVAQSNEMSALLGRAATVLNASGVIVWMASSDGQELYPAASAGYDDRLLARIGSIRRDAANVTAGALRAASPRTSPGIGPTAAALAVPLMTPLGPVGVLSAELRGVSEVDEPRMAISAIFAAQLATLLGSMATPASTAAEPPHGDTAQPAKAQA